MGIPKELKIGPFQCAKVGLARLPYGTNHAVTAFDGPGVGIVINSRAPEVHQHLALFHELIHVTEEKMRRGGVIRRLSREHYVTGLANALFRILSINGLWRGVSKRAAEEFFEVGVRAYDRKRRRAILRRHRSRRAGAGTGSGGPRTARVAPPSELATLESDPRSAPARRRKGRLKTHRRLR